MIDIPQKELDEIFAEKGVQDRRCLLKSGVNGISICPICIQAVEAPDWETW